MMTLFIDFGKTQCVSLKEWAEKSWTLPLCSASVDQCHVYQVNVTPEHYSHFFLIRFWMIELLLGEHKHIPLLPPLSNFVDVFLPGRGKVRPGNLSISQQELFKHKANVSISRWVLELTRWLAVTLVQQFTSLKNHSFFSALSHLIEFLMTVHIWAEILWSLPPWNSLSH